MKTIKAFGALVAVLLFIFACFYFDYVVFKKLHPEAGIGLYILDTLRK